MINPFEQFGFYLEITNDGSPTLRLSSGSERMHHSAGAAAETKYIYGSNIEKGLELFLKGQLADKDFNTAVVGLGLGYIEMCWAMALLKNKVEVDLKINFESYENSEILKTGFLNWIEEDKSESLYDLILEKLDPQASRPAIKKIIKDSLNLNSKICGDFFKYKEQSLIKFHIICYDAFSQQTENRIWQENFLNEFLKEKAAVDCIVTTYACTGNLKRALAQNDFVLIKRPGFDGKRDSTLAVRGRFKDYLEIFQTF